jgi:hypothetical protein
MTESRATSAIFFSGHRSFARKRMQLGNLAAVKESGEDCRTACSAYANTNSEYLEFERC